MLHKITGYEVLFAFVVEETIDLSSGSSYIERISGERAVLYFGH